MNGINDCCVSIMCVFLCADPLLRTLERKLWWRQVPSLKRSWGLLGSDCSTSTRDPPYPAFLCSALAQKPKVSRPSLCKLQLLPGILSLLNTTGADCVCVSSPLPLCSRPFPPRPLAGFCLSPTSRLLLLNKYHYISLQHSHHRVPAFQQSGPLSKAEPTRTLPLA